MNSAIISGLLKRRSITIILGISMALGFLSMLSEIEDATATVFVSGFIDTDTNWTAANSPYIVVGDITINDTATLTIEPGAEVKFDGPFSLTVQGTLISVGNDPNRITITSNGIVPKKGDWNSILVEATGSIDMQYTNVSYGKQIFQVFSSDNTFAHNIISYGSSDILHFEGSSFNIIDSNIIASSNASGMELWGGSENNLIVNNEIKNNDLNGISISSSDNNEIINNIINSNRAGAHIDNSAGTLVDANLFNNNNAGISLTSSNDNEISNNNFVENSRGINSWYSDNNNFRNNNISSNAFDGAYLLHSDGGIWEGNTISSNGWHGIYLLSSSDNSFINNTINSNSLFGLLVESSPNQYLASNEFNNDGMLLLGSFQMDINSHTIPGNNTVNSKPLLYYRDCASLDINGINLGQLIIANCNDVTINDLEIENTDAAIHVIGSSNISVSNSNLTGNLYGIYFYLTSDSLVYHNNFQGNSPQAYDWFDNMSSLNQWNDLYPSGGNYWSDYSGSDLMSGSNQDQPGSDGIGDTPNLFGFDAQDLYPLMQPYESNDGTPSSPTNSQASSSAGSVILDWEVPTISGDSPITNYKIYRGTISGDLSLLATLNDLLTYEDSAVVIGTAYYYQIAAVNDQGEGPASVEVSATPAASTPTEPTNFATQNANGLVRLTWSEPLDDGGGSYVNYKIYRGTTSGNLSLLITLGDVLLYDDAVVVNGATYYYTIVAINDLGEGPPTSEISGNPSAGPPGNLPPSITNSDITFAEVSELYQVDYDAIDPNGDDLAWSLSTDAQFLFFNPTLGLLSGTPEASDIGDWIVNVTVSDIFSTIDYHNFTLSVKPSINQAPRILNIPSIVAVEGEQYRIDYDYSDPDGDVIIWSFSSTTDFLSMNPSTGELIGTPDFSDVGNWNVTVTATDPKGLLAEQSFILIVNALPVKISTFQTEDLEAIVAIRGDGNASVTTTSNPSGNDDDGSLGSYVQLLIDGNGKLIWSNITIFYSEDDLSQGLLEQDIKLYRWDVIGQTWVVEEDSIVDPTRNTVSANITQPATFALRSSRTPVATTTDDKGESQFQTYSLFFILGSIISAGVLAALFRLEWLVFLLASMFGVLTRGKSTSDLELRGIIIGIIEAKPGVHYRWIKFHSGSSNGGCTYHLRKLEKEGLIRSKRDGVFKRFYPNSPPLVVEDADLEELKSLSAKIQDVMERNPNASQAEIGALLGESRQKINYHVNKLQERNVVKKPLTLSLSILELLKEHPGASQTEVGYLLDEPRQNINYHVSKLVKENLIRVEQNESNRSMLFLIEDKNSND